MRKNSLALVLSGVALGISLVALCLSLFTMWGVRATAPSTPLPNQPIAMPQGGPQEIGDPVAGVAAIVANPRVGHTLGSAKAPITVVEFSDFGCPYCGKFAREVLPAIRTEMIETGLVRWKYMPFLLGSFRNGEAAVIAAECVAEQGDAAFWKMHDALYADQRTWQTTDDPTAYLRGLAEKAGARVARYDACVKEGRPRAKIGEVMQLAQTVGINSTPTFFVNGRRVRGAIPLNEFRSLIAQIKP